jgi:hypothetical protein
MAGTLSRHFLRQKKLAKIFKKVLDTSPQSWYHVRITIPMKLVGFVCIIRGVAL